MAFDFLAKIEFNAWGKYAWARVYSVEYGKVNKNNGGRYAVAHYYADGVECVFRRESNELNIDDSIEVVYSERNPHFFKILKP